MIKKLIISIVLVGVVSSFNIENVFAEKRNSTSFVDYNVRMLPWDKVNEIIPRYTKFHVVDTETGLTFSVQRRAGSKHADVQPLTQKDTKIMKEIYNGQWSWKRRSILVQINGKLIAASMHGMPHGAGALKNGFPGHFCIHFLGSTTHRTSRADQSHHIMILKAAGQLEEYLSTLNPDEMINVLLVAINNADLTLLNDIVLFENKSIRKKFQKEIHFDYTIKPYSIVTPTKETLLTADTGPELAIFKKGERERKAMINFLLIREQVRGQWKFLANRELYRQLFEPEKD
ncbi:hypothetical protein [Pseudalkalibacillus caeni]|uniref:Uncharacterized protein n=1 Tax=Exobacillus caeni TaxID=2574798 RepID=A0A5R9EY75_9BACL|nr:hypothetical protein [Pseudalkalibacillus caeni]TLS35449.1 hypothetical protein FCL54_20345 [Pseudalkalibacillus caeni]